MTLSDGAQDRIRRNSSPLSASRDLRAGEHAFAVEGLRARARALRGVGGSALAGRRSGSCRPSARMEAMRVREARAGIGRDVAVVARVQTAGGAVHGDAETGRRRARRARRAEGRADRSGRRRKSRDRSASRSRCAASVRARLGEPASSSPSRKNLRLAESGMFAARSASMAASMATIGRFVVAGRARVDARIVGERIAARRPTGRSAAPSSRRPARSVGVKGGVTHALPAADRLAVEVRVEEQRARRARRARVRHRRTTGASGVSRMRALMPRRSSMATSASALRRMSAWIVGDVRQRQQRAQFVDDGLFVAGDACARPPSPPPRAALRGGKRIGAAAGWQAATRTGNTIRRA